MVYSDLILRLLIYRLLRLTWILHVQIFSRFHSKPKRRKTKKNVDFCVYIIIIYITYCYLSVYFMNWTGPHQFNSGFYQYFLIFTFELLNKLYWKLIDQSVFILIPPTFPPLLSLFFTILWHIGKYLLFFLFVFEYVYFYLVLGWRHNMSHSAWFDLFSPQLLT